MIPQMNDILTLMLMLTVVRIDRTLKLSILVHMRGHSGFIFFVFH